MKAGLSKQERKYMHGYGTFSLLAHKRGYWSPGWVVHNVYLIDSEHSTGNPPDKGDIQFALDILSDLHPTMYNMTYTLYEQIPGDYRLLVSFKTPGRERPSKEERERVTKRRTALSHRIKEVEQHGRTH